MFYIPYSYDIILLGNIPSPNLHIPFSKSYLVLIVSPGPSSLVCKANIVFDLTNYIIDITCMCIKKNLCDLADNAPPTASVFQ